MKNLFTLLALFLAVAILPGNTIQAKEQWTAVKGNLYDDCYVLNPSAKSLFAFDWTSPTSATLMMPCPVTQDIQLAPGECGIVVPTFGFAFPDISVADIPTNPNLNPTLINSTIYCTSGQTKYSRTFTHNGPTDLRVSTINLGVYRSMNNPLVTVNFYNTSGLLLGTCSKLIPALDKTVYSFSVPVGTDIKIPAFSSYVMEVVTNAPYISVFKIGRNDAGHNTGFSEATIQAIDCPNALNTEIDAGSPGITPNAVVFGIVGTPDDYKYANLNNNFNEGDYFPIGNHVMSYLVTDSNSGSTACAFNINVLEYKSSSGALACNDLVQVSLGDSCKTIVTPQMLLQGSDYGCYNNFRVQIIGINGANLGNVVTGANIGQQLKTQIIGPNGNSCWGEILVQDKFGPTLVCDDIYATCSTDLRPGSLLSPRVPVVAPITDGSIGLDVPSSTRSFVIPVAHLQGTIISDINVYLDIQHTRVSDLSANITSPDGVTVPLFLGLNCNGQDLMLTLDDESNNTNLMLQNTCELTEPAIAGKFKPYNPLSIFDGKPLEGDWVVTVFDNVTGESGNVNNVHLIFTQTGGTIPFPIAGPVTATFVSEGIYLVDGADNCGKGTLSYKDEIVEEDCSSIYAQIIKRCWTGSDSRGNISVPCCQFIYVYRNSLSTLQFPPNYDGLNGNPRPLSCEIYGDSIPPTSVTGVPFGDLCENVQIADPVDVRIDICERSYKLLRTHKVIEWCSGEVIVHNQIIKVLDENGPEMECPDNITISTDDYTCTSTYTAPKPEIIFECSDDLVYFLSYNSFNDVDSEYVSINVDQASGVINGLPIGNNWVKWRVTDECGNYSECKYRVTVVDRVLPNAVCDQFTVVSITGNGRAIVEAETFDDGSRDNCGILRFEARKMVDICNSGSLVFRPTVEFCCEEVNTTVMVEFRVTDIYGNSNTCMVEVTVKDKLPPYITKCPADITMDCQADYTDLDVTGEPEYVDNCEVVDVKHQDEVVINQCGVGTVTRTWTVTDKQGYKNSCVQVITLYNDDPFYYNIYDINDPKNDIVWPLNYETHICYSDLNPSDLPEGYNKPTYNDDNCSLVAAHYKDQVFKFVDGACEKILRTWTVLDWCTYNDQYPVRGQGWYEHVQIIKLLNDVPPIFETACQDRTFASYGNCEESIDFTMTAVDDCPEDNTDLVWTYELYTENGTVPIDVVNSARFFRTLANGRYRIKWTVADKCGNRTFCTQYINIVERKKPTPYCISSLTTAVMNSNGTISIWAKDYDKGAFDNCTKQEDLWFTFNGASPVPSLIKEEHYFKADGIPATKAEYEAGDAQIWIPANNTSGMLFDCSDIPNGISQDVSVQVWVFDQAGNYDYCTVTIVLQDNSDFCPDDNTTRVVINGKTLVGSNGLKGAEVILQSNLPEQNKTVVTDAAGSYSFPSLPKAADYTVSMSDNRNILNGVSTLDLVMIQRHILGLEVFSDPKKVIAADVDNNTKVTASDLVALRKNILGIVTEFPNNQKSWRFVTANHVFTSTSQPFPFTEKYTFNQLNDNKVVQNFYGVKIGDVNNSATVNANNDQVESRSDKMLALNVTPVKAVKGQVVNVPVYASSFDHIFGYQFTFGFDAGAFTFAGYQSEALEMSDANFGFHMAEKGIITTSWNSDQPVTLPEGEILFTMQFKAKTDRNENQILKVSSDVTPAMAFDGGYNVMKVALTPRSAIASEGFELMQNKPNPFNSVTVITFRLPQAGSAKVTLTDITGKMIKVIQGDYAKGENSIEVNANELNTSGVIFYKIESGQYTDTKKMIIIE